MLMKILWENFLGAEEISAEEIKAAWPKGTMQMKLTPVICGTAC